MATLKIDLYRGQAGSALTEFIVLTVVLVPLMFGIPMIGKMIDLKQTTVQASRYSAWETTVNSGGATAQTIDQRFFSDASAPIGETAPAPNSLWGVPTQPSGDQTTAREGEDPAQILSGYMADTAVTVGAGATMAAPSAYEPGMKNGVQYAPAASEGAARQVGKAVNAIGGLEHSSGGEWGMATDGLIRGQTSVTMQGNGWLDTQTLTHDTVIMNDNWSVDGALAARNRVRSLVPGGVLAPVGIALGAVGNIPGLRELRTFGGDSGRRVFGHVNVEPLPPSENQGPRELKVYEE